MAVTRVLVIDNYDSFTYNLVQYLGELGAEVEAVRNDAAQVDQLLEGGWDRVVVSPGPCTPNEAGISVEAMRRFPEAGVPTLGVCLGHQSLAQAFGGKVVRNDVTTVDELLARGYDRVVVSPGPCTPNEAGISVEAVSYTHLTLPTNREV